MLTAIQCQSQPTAPDDPLRVSPHRSPPPPSCSSSLRSLHFSPHLTKGLINGMSCDDFYYHQHTAYRPRPDEFKPFFDNTDKSFVQVMGDNNPKGNNASNFSSRCVVDSPENCDITSDAALNYISRMLMEEDIDEKVSMYQEEAALQATEKPFYDILGQEYPTSPDRLPPYRNHSSTCTDESSSSSRGKSNSSRSSSGLVDNSCWTHHLADYPDAIDFSPQPLLGSSSGAGNILVSFREPLISAELLPNSQVEILPTLQFRKGVEEAKKFLPSIDKLVIDLEADTFSFLRMPKKVSPLVEVREEEDEDKKEPLIYDSRGKKNPQDDVSDLLEGRSNKQSAVYFDDPIRNEMFDKALLCQGKKHMEDAIQLRELMENEASKNSQNGPTKGSNGGKKRGKKQTKKEVVDLRTLLMHCAEAVATNDRRMATELLQQIREHSSPNGDGCQRLAHCFANGLEARLAGTGSQIYQELVAKRTTASDFLKAHHLFIAASPFMRASHYFSNQTILNVTEKASKVHVVDFGVYFGFKWPSFIQRLSKRQGGPPKLRITGIDVPQPGFRPSKQVEETGRRLADYAREFKVPFEYQAMASKWETIRVEDINIDKDEVLIVSCLFRFRYVADETVAMDSPRDKVLNTIKQMNPSVFILGIANGSYSSPFFVTRFREALFHCTALFDMLDTNVPRDNKQRLLMEKDLFGKAALNVIACEGSERVERPETYKQWQVRNLRAGFMQLPLNPDIMKKIKDKVRAIYHKDFVVDEDKQWLLQGWKGRIVYALSTWRPSKT